MSNLYEVIVLWRGFMVQLPKLLWNRLAHSKEVRLQERGNRMRKLSRVVASSLFFLSMLFVGLQGAQATPGQGLFKCSTTRPGRTMPWLLFSACIPIVTDESPNQRMT